MFRVCICILNYNNAHKTIAAVQSALNQTYGNIGIVIVDNASSDDSLVVLQDFLTKNSYDFTLLDEFDIGTNQEKPCSAVSLLVSKQNGGYSRGNNLGIRFAKSFSAFSHVLIVNNDVIMAGNFVEDLVVSYNGFVDVHRTKSIAIGSFEYNAEGERTHKGFHYINLLSGLAFKYPIPPYFRYIVGSCILLPVETPLMDESYFLYYDDAQFSKILIKEGYLLETCSVSFFTHEGNATTKSIDSMYKVVFKSMKHFYILNYPYIYPVVILMRFCQDIFRGNFIKALQLIKSAFQPHV